MLFFMASGNLVFLEIDVWSEAIKKIFSFANQSVSKLKVYDHFSSAARCDINLGSAKQN